MVYNNCFNFIHQNASVPNGFDILSDDSACHWRHVNMLFFATAKWWNFKRLGRSGRHWKTRGQQNHVLRGSFSLAPVGFHKLGDSLSPPYFIHSAMLINLELWTPPPRHINHQPSRIFLSFSGPPVPWKYDNEVLPLQEEDSPALQHPIVLLGFQLSTLLPDSCALVEQRRHDSRGDAGFSCQNARATHCLVWRPGKWSIRVSERARPKWWV